MPGEHQRQVLKGTKPTAAQLVKREGRFFLHVQISGEAPNPIDPADFIGVDLGIANIATDSDGKRHSGAGVDKNQAVFLCKQCGHSENADVNAARNIRALAASKTAIELAIIDPGCGPGRDQPESPRL